MAYAALISLYTTITDIGLSSHISFSPTSVSILMLAITAAESLRKTLKLLDESSKRYSRKNVNALDERIKAAVWKLEDLLDSHVYHQILPQSQIIGGGTVIEVHLDEIIHEIESFTKKLEEFKVEYMDELDRLSPEEDVDVDVASASAEEGVKKCKMVGSFYFLWAHIRRQLEMKSSLDVLSLVGMGGIGKTTLAKKIFDESLDFTGFEFECRAWVTIGRKWEPEKLIRDIITQLEYHSEEGERNEGYSLNGVSKAKRCLIVLDDVWDTDVWDQFKRSFPTHIFNGRTLVLLTTRLWHVASNGEAWTYTLNLLNQDESWDLLCQRVFGEEDSCPPELEKAGKEIAQKCDGLPLMIVTVADLLSQAEMTEEYWESVAEKKNSSIFTTAYDRVSEVLFPSYEYLPQQLKPCFLYMGVFRQSWKIRTSWLLDRWIAEGFLLSYENETMKESSERYLWDLFNHSVVIICHNSVNYLATKRGREIKSSRLQSCFWHLCRREATNTKFSHVLSTLVDVQQSMINTQRRLSFHNNILLAINNLSDLVRDACASTARSLLLYGPYHPYPVPICFNLRLLKVLDAFYIRFYEFPVLVFQLVYLRFLNLTCNDELPSSISKLWNLQFLIIGLPMIIKHSRVTSYMPIEIWDMKQLKRLQVVGSNLPNPSSDASLERLLSLKYIGVETCTKEILERIPNLKKLGILVYLHPGDDDDDMKALHCLNHVHVLRELTSLKCEVWNPILTSEIVAQPAPLPTLPSSLKKLHLSGTGYPWSYMSVIGSLAHLEVLKLRSYAFRGSEWVVKDRQFQTLNVLIIEGTDLVRFKVELGGFIDLQRLYFSNCYKLRDLQWEPDQSSSLIISVIDCSTSIVTFANEYNSTRESHIPEEHRWKYVTSSYMK